MSPILWIIVALAVAGGLLYVAVRRTQRHLPPLTLPQGEKLPKTALQRLAETSFIAVATLSAAAATIVVFFGVEAFWDRDAVRLSATGFVLAALAVFTYYSLRVAAWSARDDGKLDERDRAILASAPAAQAPALMVTLAAWMIGLTESFHTTAEVPTVFLYLIFWSCTMVTVASLLAGIVVGYRRS
ncbi:MAG: hypothetical protein JNM59_05635 [Hyphomonadaceae bacterium]|nr:hypothetical protein [Hyphomonadaceae bacterium]